MTQDQTLPPVRILQVVGYMGRGGIETWLMHVLRHIDKERYRMDFLVHTPVACAYDEEIRALGSRVIPIRHALQPWWYMRLFRRMLKEYGPYDVVHTHAGSFGGIALHVAEQEGIGTRIAHSHTGPSGRRARRPLVGRPYEALKRHWLRRHALAGFAPSREAARFLFGPEWESDPRWGILRYGIDLQPFHAPVDGASLRAEFGIANSLVLGHVGRFAEVKNHAFLLQVFSEVLNREPSAKLLLIGDGPLRAVTEQRADDLGIRDHVVFLGERPDIPRLLSGAVDVFVFPSHYEGLPLTCLEAQAAGLPIIVSEAVTPELVIVPELVQRLSLARSAEEWADRVLAAPRIREDSARREALQRVEGSPFSISASVQALTSVYDRARSPEVVAMH